MRALLFLVIGLALGLWLGFNPAAHRSLVRWWNREETARVSGRPLASLNVRPLERSLKSSQKPLAQTGSQTNTIPTTGQIGSELHAFELALQRIWLELLGKLGIRTAGT